MKNAPFACPKCGEEKGWRCLNDPAANEMGRGKQAFIEGAFGRLGLTIAQAIYKGKKLKYHCNKCGFEETYKPD